MRAQQQLGARAAELKTRDELIDALEAHEAKLARRAPRAFQPLASPLPAPTAAIATKGSIEPPAMPLPAPVVPEVKELPPEPMIWTGAEPLPQITASAAELPEPTPPGEPDTSSVLGDFFTTELAEDTRYEDDRVLAFTRDPQTVYASWDFSRLRFDRGAAQGTVVDADGVPVHSFWIETPHGGVFLAPLPPGLPLKIEVRHEEQLLGESGWVTLEQPPAEKSAAPIVRAPSSSVT